MVANGGYYAMVNNSDKLTIILPYMRSMDDETKKRLEKLRQANGSGASIAVTGYGELLDKIYKVHEKFEKEKDEQCRALMQKVNQIQKKLQDQCFEEIIRLVEKTLASKSGV